MHASKAQKKTELRCPAGRACFQTIPKIVFPIAQADQWKRHAQTGFMGFI
jgi:hypothetical protein